MVKTISITGMKCEHCSAAVTKALSELEGVTAVNVDLAGGKATVDAVDVTDEALTEAIEDIGFDVTGIK